MVQYRDQWRALVNTAMDLHIPYEMDQICECYLTKMFLINKSCMHLQYPSEPSIR
jgi:hypothetical protein